MVRTREPHGESKARPKGREPRPSSLMRGTATKYIFAFILVRYQGTRDGRALMMAWYEYCAAARKVGEFNQKSTQASSRAEDRPGQAPSPVCNSICRRGKTSFFLRFSPAFPFSLSPNTPKRAKDREAPSNSHRRTTKNDEAKRKQRQRIKRKALKGTPALACPWLDCRLLLLTRCVAWGATQ